VPHGMFALIAFSYASAMWCSTRALRFVNYPTQVLGKSCKAVPIVLVSTILGKKYTCYQYLSISLVVGGVAIFNLYKASSHKHAEHTSTLYGLSLVGASLLFDGLTGALEDKVITKLGWGHGKGTFQLMLFINFWAVPITFVLTCLEVGGMPDFLLSPSYIKSTVVLGLAGSLGQFFIFYTISHFGALVCSIVTTCRKVITILFSIVLYGHTLTTMQVVGLGVSFSGFGVDILAKKMKKKNSNAGGH